MIYEELVLFLVGLNFTLITSEEEYKIKDEVIFSCNKNHKLELNKLSLYNKKKSFTRGEITEFCSICKKEKELQEKFEEISNQILHNHKLIKLLPDRKCIFKCINCGEINESYIKPLIKDNKGGCKNCYRTLHDQKTDINIVKNKVERYGFTLEKYVNKEEVHLICKNDFYKNKYKNYKRW